jgi:WXG100 family type VII secretion target
MRNAEEMAVGSPGTATGGGADLGYDPSAMAKGLTAIDGATTEVRSLLNTIQQEVDALGGSWRASSNVAFTQVHAKWADHAALINNALHTMHEKLAATDVAYAKTEQAQIDQYQALANSI